MDVKLGETELKLAEAESLNLAQADEIADLKVALEACEDNWYNAGFADAENSVEPIVYQASRNGFEEGWIAALQAMGVLDDSPLRNPKQIPFLGPPPLVQNPSGTNDEQDTPSMKELVQEIDFHVELVELKVTRNFDNALHIASFGLQILVPSLPGMFKLSHALLLNMPGISQFSLPWTLFRLSPFIYCLSPKKMVNLLFCLFFSLFIIFFLFSVCLWSPGCGDRTLILLWFMLILFGLFSHHDMVTGHLFWPYL